MALTLPVCLLLDSTNQHHGRSYTCSVRDTIDQRQTTFPSIRFMQKHGWAMNMTFNWRSYDISWNRQMIGGSVHPLLASNVAKTRSFWRYSVIKICLFNYFPNAIFGGQFISVELLHCGRPRECKRRHFLFRLITCLVTKPQYYSSLLSNKPGHFSKAGHFSFESTPFLANFLSVLW